MTKICSKCKEVKPTSEFYKHWDKLQGYCKECTCKTATEYQNTHAERYRILAKKRHARMKLQALQHYSGNPPSCTACGEADIMVLCVDHIDGGGALHRRELRASGKGNMYYWLRHNNYPAGFQILCANFLCANCNMRKLIRNKESRL